MLNNIFSTIITGDNLTGSGFIVSTVMSLACGLIIALSYMYKNKYSKSFATTLVLLPAIVELVIMLVNGNIGAGIAVAGAFSLVRFRSAPGKGQEITAVFLAMAVGLATGMGYIWIALLFALVLSLINLVLNLTGFGSENGNVRMLKILVPENLDYEDVFDDILKKYLSEYSYDEVKLTNMGSLYKITLRVILKEGVSSKKMLDEIRTKNGNLDISLGRMTDTPETL